VECEKDLEKAMQQTAFTINSANRLVGGLSSESVGHLLDFYWEERTKAFVELTLHLSQSEFEECKKNS
jgi:hypothetical protein